MIVCHFGDGSKSAFSAHNTVLSECILTRQDVFADSSSLWQDSELALWQVYSENAKAVSDSLLYELRVFGCFGLADFEELLCKFVEHLVVLADVCVFNIVAEETKCVEQLVLGQLS